MYTKKSEPQLLLDRGTLDWAWAIAPIIPLRAGPACSQNI